MAIESQDYKGIKDYIWTSPSSPDSNSETIIAEYVWIDGDGGLRSKIKILPSISTAPKGNLTITLATFPDWNL